MDVHIIIDHPRKNSFNHAVLESFAAGVRAAGHFPDILDLCEDGFEPGISPAELSAYSGGYSTDPKVSEYQERLSSAGYLAMVFPIWWSLMPSRMKGWMDKVFRPGFAMTAGIDPKPLLGHINGATILTTSGSPDSVIREASQNGLYGALCKGALGFCGISPSEWLNFGGTGVVPREEHTQWLDEVYEHARYLNFEQGPQTQG
ncbi:MAG: NAD(P)H-dependent oxidoreductase [Spirochaetales bacterium]